MIVFKKIEALQRYLAICRQKNKIIGFVPISGALHHGIISLRHLCSQLCDISVVSIFINPTQFNDPADFEKYPVTISEDLLQLEANNCDIVFLPSVKEVYPNGVQSTTQYDLGELENVLEGKYRPGHFQGVAQVVHRLLEIVQPTSLFLGQKDFQQCMVLKKLCKLINSQVKVITGETHREPSGLAMSSRNLRLSEIQKQQATAIFNVLQYIKQHYGLQANRRLIEYATNYLLTHGFQKVDYVAIVNAETLLPIDNSASDQVVALVAAFIGDVRLIDNMIIR